MYPSTNSAVRTEQTLLPACRGRETRLLRTHDPVWVQSRGMPRELARLAKNMFATARRCGSPPAASPNVAVICQVENEERQDSRLPRLKRSAGFYVAGRSLQVYARASVDFMTFLQYVHIPKRICWPKSDGLKSPLCFDHPLPHCLGTIDAPCPLLLRPAVFHRSQTWRDQPSPRTNSSRTNYLDDRRDPKAQLLVLQVGRMKDAAK